jgi:hypothetical protein
LANQVSGQQYAHITSATTTVVKPARGTLVRILFNLSAAGAVTVYDNTAASGTVIAVISASAAGTPYGVTFECDFKVGLTIVTAATVDLTVVYF